MHKSIYYLAIDILRNLLV